MSDPDQTAVHRRSSAVSQTLTAETLNPLNSAWIRRLHVSSSPSPSPRTLTISTNESHTPDLGFRVLGRSEEEERRSDDVAGIGFGPFQIKAKNQKCEKIETRVLERDEGFKAEGGDSETRVCEREVGFKISPFFRVLPPLANAQLALPDISTRIFAMNNGEAEICTADPTVRFQEQNANYINRQEEPFSYWNLGRFNLAKNASSSQIPLRNNDNNLHRKRNPVADLFFPSKFRRSGEE